MKTENIKTIELTFTELFEAIEQYANSKGITIKVEAIKEVSYLGDSVTFKTE